MTSTDYLRRCWRVPVVGLPAAVLAFAVQRTLGATLDPTRIGPVLVATAGTVAVLEGPQAAGTPWVVLAIVAAAVYVTLLHRLGFTRSIQGAVA